jgi:energy-coupling factor transporter ATP-binding protein EcfA2
MTTDPTVQTLAALAARIRTLETPVVVAVDGRSASGKTTLAARLAQALDAPTVHTDDVAWHHSFFDWWPLLTQHVLEPFRAGRAVDWTPDAWTAQGREGSILVPVGPILVLEGVSATRQEFADHVRFPIWVETPPDVAEFAASSATARTGGTSGSSGRRASARFSSATGLGIAPH